MDEQEGQLAQSLARRDEASFETVFKTHFKNLHAYACTITREAAAAEEVVQNVQKGIRSRFYKYGRYSVKREQGTHHFHSLIAEFMQ